MRRLSVGQKTSLILIVLAVFGIFGLVVFQQNSKDIEVKQDLTIDKALDKIPQDFPQLRYQKYVAEKNQKGEYYITKINGKKLTLSNGQKYTCEGFEQDMETENVTGWVNIKTNSRMQVSIPRINGKYVRTETTHKCRRLN